MFKIERSEINLVETAILDAMKTAKTMDGHAIRLPVLSGKAVRRCAMIAIQAAAMELTSGDDIAVPSDVTHFAGGKEIA